MGREYELDENMQRTGRWRRTQFTRTMRWQAMPPSKRTTMPWSGHVQSVSADEKAKT
jgi:hypothetical protein